MYILKQGEENRFQDLVPLGETDWPEEVKREISAFFKKVGVADPYKQKLVEPSLSGFKLRGADGGIDWEDVVAYFKYEALTVLITQDKDTRRQAEKLYSEFFADHKDRIRSQD